MTQAAKELHLTQSGVSQQIKALEETLGVVLFDRVNRKIVPTHESDILYRECSQRLDDLEHTLERITKQKRDVAGHIRIGFPPAFGNFVLLPVIARFARDNPLVTFDFREGFVAEIVHLLMDGKLDCAFVDSFATDSHVTAEVVASEALELYCHKDVLAHFGEYDATPSFIKQLPFIEYVEGEPILRAWFQHNFGYAPHDFHVTAHVMNPSCVARLVLEGLGAGILPKALISHLGPERDSIQPLPGTKALQNRISLASLTSRTHSPVVVKCMNWLKKELGDNIGNSISKDYGNS